MAPVFSHGDLRLYLLSLLDEGPRHGYDIMQALSDRTGGTYTPSAGTIYPRLAKLEEEGLVTKESDGRKTVYAITDAGRAELDTRSPELEGIESELSDSVRRLADEVRASVTDAMKTLRADLAAAAREVREETKGAAASAGRSTSTDHDDPRVRARAQLQDAEAALAEFRASLRADLRLEVSRGRLDPSVVQLLTTRLGEVRREVVAALRS